MFSISKSTTFLSAIIRYISVIPVPLCPGPIGPQHLRDCRRSASSSSRFDSSTPIRRLIWDNHKLNRSSFTIFQRTFQFFKNAVCKGRFQLSSAPGSKEAEVSGYFPEGKMGERGENRKSEKCSMKFCWLFSFVTPEANIRTKSKKDCPLFFRVESLENVSDCDDHGQNWT